MSENPLVSRAADRPGLTVAPTFAIMVLLT